jgi:SAM-dependent methyltransferase
MSDEIRDENLPAEFIAKLEALGSSLLQEEDPIRQSGFGGGPERWRAEREPILDGVDEDGTFLDIGCANGYLLECLVAWARERGAELDPHGLDRSAGLVGLARERLPAFASQLFVGNAWSWESPRRFRYVYTLDDCVPPEYLSRYVRRILGSMVEPAGRLILGAYGSRSRGIPPSDVEGFLRALGLAVAGSAAGGDPPITRFAWVDARASHGRMITG